MTDKVWPHLHQAVLGGEPAAVTALLDRGADIEAKVDNGLTALHLAVREGEDPAVVRLLLDYGADIEAREDDFGWTPLHMATRHSK
ncbi:MAG: ankyrin repeat domain-containing protein, partial [Chloroflexi bacterium]|nr:ankyrin repeat domain-containing protein [Chloroflexota bacterium]